MALVSKATITASTGTVTTNVVPINTNGVNAITGAMMNTALNSAVGMIKILIDLNDSTFNLVTNNTDDITDTATNRFVTDVDIINWNNKVEHGETVTINVVVTPTTATINYLDHASNPQSMVVVTGVSVTATGVVD